MGFHFTHTATAAHKIGQSNYGRKQHRHSIAGVLPIQRTQSDNLPSPANDSKDQSQLALKKVMSDGSVKAEGEIHTNSCFNIVFLLLKEDL